jgi:hypothetical protein
VEAVEKVTATPATAQAWWHAGVRVSDTDSAVHLAGLASLTTHAGALGAVCQVGQATIS